MLAPWKKSYGKPRQHIEKQRHHFANKGPYCQSYGFSRSPMLDHKEMMSECWAIEKDECQIIDAFELWC